MPHAIREALRRVEPTVDVRVIGEPGCPPLGSEDRDLLRWIQDEERILVTRNRRTIPVYFAEHLAAGGHVAGILLVGEDFSMMQLVEELLLIWAGSEAGEWRDRLVYLPLTLR